MAIRYDASLNKELKRTVSNFNRKIARLEKEGRELLPDKVYVADLKEFYQDRRELKRKLKELQRFSERGVEEIITTEGGVKKSIYDIENLKREKTLSQRRLTLEQRRLERLSTPTTLLRNAELNRVKSVKNLLNKDLFKLNKRDLEIYQANINRTLNKDHKLEQFQENFIQMLQSNIAFAGTAEYKLEHIYDKVRELTPEQLLRMSREDPTIKAMLDYYPDDENFYISKNLTRDVMDELYDRIDSIVAEYAE